MLTECSQQCGSKNLTLLATICTTSQILTQPNPQTVVILRPNPIQPNLWMDPTNVQLCGRGVYFHPFHVHATTLRPKASIPLVDRTKFWQGETVSTKPKVFPRVHAKTESRCHQPQFPSLKYTRMRWRRGLRPIPHWESLHRSARRPIVAIFWGRAISKALRG